MHVHTFHYFDLTAVVGRIHLNFQGFCKKQGLVYWQPCTLNMVAAFEEIESWSKQNKFPKDANLFTIKNLSTCTTKINRLQVVSFFS